MRLVEKLLLGGGVAGTATALGIAVAGLATTTAVVVTGPLAAPAGAEALKPFAGCDQLRDWYVGRALREVGPWGWGGGRLYAYDGLERSGTMDLATGVPVPAAAPGSAPVAGSTSVAEQAGTETGTNVQEAGVDEPDIAKSDGKRVVRIVNGNDGRGTLVVSDVTGTRPVELGRLALPEDATYGAELLLSGDHALVVTTGGGVVYPMGDVIYDGPMRPGPSGSKLLDVDLADPAHPRLAHAENYDGTIVSARLYGDTVRVVTSTPRPDLPFTYPEKGISEQTAKARNQAAVRQTTIEDWLPSVTVNGLRTPLVSCDQVLHPPTPGGLETLTVTTFPADDAEDRSAVAVTADGQVVYSATDRLYVATVRMDQPDQPNPGIARDRVLVAPLDVKTDVHAFALDGRRTTYVASGTVDGSVRDRWSMDSYDGVLRVAWTRDRWTKAGREHVRNGLTTFTEEGGRLVPRGEVGDLGIDENLQSVRWFDDLAVLVTFRQMDPLYTVDLRDPAHPRTLGALKIPGYSGYLHPIGPDRLLGLGVSATEEGRRTGTQAAVFDLADLTHPRQTGKVDLGGESSDLPALGDPRGFTWLPDGDTGLTTVTDWTGRGELVALEVTGAGGISSRVVARDLQGWQARTLPLPDGRVALVDRDLRLLDLP
ncbi:MAG: beta-propeller domain-containing protein [Nocardioidaceae bacterium]|nr:beta-propeller domain-containing protein [Nocardioidaceae bacterium]